MLITGNNCNIVHCWRCTFFSSMLRAFWSLLWFKLLFCNRLRATKHVPSSSDWPMLVPTEIHDAIVGTGAKAVPELLKSIRNYRKHFSRQRTFTLEEHQRTLAAIEDALGKRHDVKPAKQIQMQKRSTKTRKKKTNNRRKRPRERFRAFHFDPSSETIARHSYEKDREFKAHVDWLKNLKDSCPLHETPFGRKVCTCNVDSFAFFNLLCRLCQIFIQN